MTNARENWPELRDGLMLLVDELSGRLEKSSSEIVREFVENREFGLALEWMYSAALEQSVELSKSERERFDRLAHLMDMYLG